MKTYERRVRVDGFHVLQTEGNGAEIQYSFPINIEGEWVRESIAEWFDNIGDAPHIGEFVTIEVQVFETDAGTDTWTLERVGW